jgi:polyhydroxyalkanoate synthesis regulator phasin
MNETNERKIHYIDIGNMSMKEAKEFLDTIKLEIRKETCHPHKPVNRFIEIMAIAASFGGFNIHL